MSIPAAIALGIPIGLVLAVGIYVVDRTIAEWRYWGAPWK